jgi:hypothetical protein
MRPFLMMQYEYKVSAKLKYELWVLDVFFMMWERYFSILSIFRFVPFGGADRTVIEQLNGGLDNVISAKPLIL